MNSKKAPDIGVIYYKGLFDEKEIYEIKRQFDICEYSFDTAEKDSVVLACLDFFVPIAQIVLSAEFLKQITYGIISDFAYDLVKKGCLDIWHSVIAKKKKKITGNKITEYEGCVHLSGNGFNAVFPQTTDEEIIKYFIDKSFEYLSTNSAKNKEFVVLDVNSLKMHRFSEREIIEIAMKEQQNKDSSKED